MIDGVNIPTPALPFKGRAGVGMGHQAVGQTQC